MNNSAILGLLYSVTEFKVTFLKYKYEMNNWILKLAVYSVSPIFLKFGTVSTS